MIVDKYNEALERAKKAIIDCGDNEGRKKMIKEIFPELKEEREGERIRKVIADIVKAQPSDSLFNGTKEKCLAWLKEQGEQKPADDKLVDEIAKGVRIKWALDFINYLDANCYDGKMCVSNGECEDIEDAFISADWNKLYRYYNKYLQKPAWSEEDKTVLNNLIYALANDRIGNDRDEYISWLESLKDRVQSKQEWSEEDENIFRDIVARLHSHPNVDKTEYDKSYHWLKSLRPQKLWKPSQEQMNQLEGIAKQNKDNMIGKELMTLYNDLKNL